MEQPPENSTESDVTRFGNELTALLSMAKTMAQKNADDLANELRLTGAIASCSSVIRKANYHAASMLLNALEAAQPKETMVLSPTRAEQIAGEISENWVLGRDA